MTKQEIIKTLEGQEVLSIQFEGIVAIKDGKVINYHDGKMINPTIAQWKELFQEAFEQEFGTRNVMTLLREEFEHYR